MKRRRTSGPTQPPQGAPGGRITAVAEGGLAWRMGLRPGDVLVQVNGQPVRDLIDYRFWVADEQVTFGLWRDGRWVVRKGLREYGEDVGLDFAEPVFDGVRLCHNHCPFCFLRGLPQGMRPSLRVQDDDYRLSFLFGNFVTLTNLTEEDWQRIEVQRLSPLYVSVHATDPEARRRCFGLRHPPDILAQLARLARLEVDVHAQVVLTPGLNDGAVLEKTLADLAERFPTVRSVSLVPVGLTRYSPPQLRSPDRAEAAGLLTQVRRWQEQALDRWGRRWVYAADEWYFLAGRRLPAAASYEGFPQLENGVGLTRHLLDDWARWRRRLRGRACPARAGRFVLLCGTMIAPVLQRVAGELAALSGAQIEVRSVVNRFFGPSVTVSGLLSGADVAAAVAPGEDAAAVLLPRVMLDQSGERTLDDWTLTALEAQWQRPACPLGTVRELAAAVCGEGGAG
ncbi:MAG: DUF512 domain-containing protein [Chloroflexi bacterium]|nr:DUF512 domain-containing protein [Chloroflexota bacterium]